LNIKKKILSIIVGVIILGLLAIGVPYVISLFGSSSDGLIGEEPVTPSPSNEKPVHNPEPSMEPVEEPDPAEEVINEPDSEPANDPDKHMIYVGEQLKIPFRGGSGTNQSIVIKSAVLQSNDECDIALISFFCSFSKLVQMLYSALGRCVRKISNAVYFQCAAFDLNENLSGVTLHIEIHSVLSISIFWLEQGDVFK
jgi:hypothetical protein